MLWDAASLLMKLTVFNELHKNNEVAYNKTYNS